MQALCINISNDIEKNYIPINVNQPPPLIYVNNDHLCEQPWMQVALATIECRFWKQPRKLFQLLYSAVW